MTTPAIQKPDDEHALKDAFAAALLRNPNDPFRAACAIFGSDTMRALQVSQQWTYDFYVLNKQAELLEQLGEDEFLPSKATLARRVFELAETQNADKKDRLAAYRLYAEIRDFLPKGGGGTNVNIQNTINQNRVMILKDHGDDSQWETRAASQQAKLIADART